MSRRALIGIAAAVALAAIAVASRGAWTTLRDPAGEEPASGWEAARRGLRHETSERCEPCHPSHQASWARTHHAKMTQWPAPDTIVAPFDGRHVEIEGVDSVPLRRGDAYFIITENPATGVREEMRVALVTGSRRQQQFHVRLGDRFVRLPLAWSITEQRWFNLSEAFFHPDGAPFSFHASVWDLNCIFCHTVRPAPGIRDDGSIESSVAEIGIACEACHGPAEEHLARMRSPLRRAGFNARNGRLGDPTIVNPARLDPARSVDTCGHCHGNRVPANVDEVHGIFERGDPFRPGEILARTWAPITRETSVEGLTFAHRFWPDGSPRLTAYELQGLRGSACEQGGMTCLTCHSMHDSDPAGQIITGLDVQDACLKCHPDFDGTAHSHHAEGSTGNRCVACHMPPTIYGIMGWHPTHLIKSPDPLAAAASQTPDACTLCHVGRSRDWAAGAVSELWGAGVERSSTRALGLDGDPEMARLSVAGDCMSRALAAWRLGEPGAPEPASESFAIPMLADLLVDDYPAVRRLAADSLRRLLDRDDVPHAFDPLEERRRWRDELVAAHPGPDEEWKARLRATREESPVGIGE